MKTLKYIAIAGAFFFLLGASTMHMWTHPAFLLVLIGCISLIYRKLFAVKPTRRYVS